MCLFLWEDTFVFGLKMGKPIWLCFPLFAVQTPLWSRLLNITLLALGTEAVVLWLRVTPRLKYTCVCISGFSYADSPVTGLCKREVFFQLYTETCAQSPLCKAGQWAWSRVGGWADQGRPIKLYSYWAIALPEHHFW